MGLPYMLTLTPKTTGIWHTWSVWVVYLLHLLYADLQSAKRKHADARLPKRQSRSKAQEAEVSLVTKKSTSLAF